MSGPSHAYECWAPRGGKCRAECSCHCHATPTTPRTCPHCKGRGAYTVKAGGIERALDPCPNCKGAGMVQVPVKLPRLARR
jgi:DnaJ-class molecular chaperone